MNSELRRRFRTFASVMVMAGCGAPVVLWGQTEFPAAPAESPATAAGEGMTAPGYGGPGGLDWAHFLAGAPQAGAHFAVPRMGSNGGQMFGGRGGMSMFAVGSGLLRTMAGASGGSMGSSLLMMSRVADVSSRGLNFGTGSGVDFRLSGSAGGMFGGGMFGGMGQGGGGGRQGSMFSTSGSMFGTTGSMFGSTGGFGGVGAPGGPHGGGGRGGGPSLSLKLKF